VFTDEQVDAAVKALSDPDRFQGAEQRLAQLAPQLQTILAQAMQEGGWFGEAHESQVRAAATADEEPERARLIRTLLAEETRMGMLVGVAVGFELARELENQEEPRGD
jgi:hypothetical protein